MSPRKKAQAAFAAAVALMFLSGLAGYFSITRLRQSEKWVMHSYEVRNALGDIDWAVLRAGRSRSGYVTSGRVEFLNQFEAAVAEIPGKLQHLRELTGDNPKQRQLCARLEAVVAERVALFRKSAQLKTEMPENEQAQADWARQNVPVSGEMASIMEQMREEEQYLLAVRHR